jgi:hypothetical protein
VEGVGAKAAADWNDPGSPETYLGHDQLDGLDSSTDLAPHRRQVYAAPGTVREGAPLPFHVLLDGRPPGDAHSLDVNASGGAPSLNRRMYQSVRQPMPIVDRRLTSNSCRRMSRQLYPRSDEINEDSAVIGTSSCRTGAPGDRTFASRRQRSRRCPRRRRPMPGSAGRGSERGVRRRDISPTLARRRISGREECRSAARAVQLDPSLPARTLAPKSSSRSPGRSASALVSVPFRPPVTGT